MALKDLGTDKPLMKAVATLTAYVTNNYSKETANKIENAINEAIFDAPERGKANDDDELPDDVEEEAGLMSMSRHEDEDDAEPSEAMADQYARHATR